MLALANGNIEEAPNFWRRMAAEHPGSIQRNHAATHPATPERFVALEKTVEEIRRKQALGLPLTPELKEKASEHTTKQDTDTIGQSLP